MLKARIRRVISIPLLCLIIFLSLQAAVNVNISAATSSIVVEIKGVKMLNIIVYCEISGFTEIKEKGALIRETGTANWKAVQSTTSINPYSISFYELKPDTDYEIKGYCIYGSRNNYYESPTAVTQRTLIPPLTRIQAINPDVTLAKVSVGLNPTVYDYMHGGFDLYLAAGNQFVKRCYVANHVTYFKSVTYTINELSSNTAYIIKPYAINHYGEVIYFDDAAFTTDKSIIINPSIKPVTLFPLPTATPSPAPSPSPTPSLSPAPTVTAAPTTQTNATTSISTTTETSLNPSEAEISGCTQQESVPATGDPSQRDESTIEFTKSQYSETTVMVTESSNADLQPTAGGTSRTLVIILAAVVAGLTAAVIFLLMTQKKNR